MLKQIVVNITIGPTNVINIYFIIKYKYIHFGCVMYSDTKYKLNYY